MSFVRKAKKSVDFTPVLDTNVYASGDRVGGIHTLSVGGEHVTLKSISVSDTANQGAELVVHFFNVLPTSVGSDNAALTVSDADIVNYVGSVVVGNTAYDLTSAASAAAYEDGIDMGFDTSASSGRVYAIVETLGTPTYTASALRFRYGFEYDHKG